MRRVYLLILVLAATAAGTSLAGWSTQPASEAALAPVPTPQSAAPQQDCTADDDVRVTDVGIYDFNRFDYGLNDPPDYASDAQIFIYYTVNNSSCREVTASVVLTGSVSGATIQIQNSTTESCTTGCTVSANVPIYGNDQWDLGKHPNATGEKVVATVTVSAPADFADSNPENNSATSAQAINIVNEEPDPAPDISVESVTPSVTTVVIGETVNFTVKVENEGDADATAETTVTLDRGADTTALDSDTVSALAAAGEGTATLSWDTGGAEAGEHSLRILAATEGDGNADNDSASVTVTLVEPSVDVAVKSVTASAAEAVIGDTVDFTVTLENRGNVPAVTPEVSLFDADGAEDAEPLETVTADTMAVDGTKTVTISWDTDEAEARTYTLRAVATVADDNDSTNDGAAASLILHNPVDVALSFTETPVATAIAGNSASVPFTVANSGNHDTGEVTVSLHVTAEGEERGEAEPEDTRTVPTIAVGGSTTGSFDWDTGDIAVGRYELEVVAAAFGDTDASNNTVSTSIEIRNWLLLKSVSPESAEAVTGDTITFTAEVENVGQEDLKDLTVVLSESQVETLLDAETIDSVAAGDTGDVIVEWDTAGQDVGQVHVFVSVGTEVQVPDEDDTQTASVTFRNPIELSSAMPASNDNIAGLPVSINVQVLNESDADISDIEVGLYVGDSDKASSIASIESITAGEAGTAVLAWDTTEVEVGEHQLKIVASVADYSRDANDELPFAITLRASVVDIALTGATINRNVAAIGQTLEIVATVANRGEAPVATPVSLYTVQDQHDTTAVAMERSPLIEPDSGENVELRWDTTGKPSGMYDLRVSVDVPDDTTPNDNTGPLTVELFNSAFEDDDAPESCLEDVRVTVDAVRDIGGQQRSTPDYQVGENLRIVYTVYNYSCDTDVAAAIAMTGPEDHAISDTATLCFSKCAVPFGGKVESEVAWTIPTLPALSDQPITATVTVISPNDFTDINEANNSAESTDRINVVHPDDILLDLGEETGNKVSTRRTLTGPEFGTVDMRLVSVDPLQTSLPFAAESVEVTVAVANDGPAAEPAAVRFILMPDDGTDPLELRRHTMVIQNGQTRTETVAVPLRDVPPGGHTIKVLLSAAVDLSLDNNTEVIEITRQEPLVEVEVTAVSISPEMPFLGDAVTVALTVQNNSDIALPLTVNLFLDDAPQTPANQDLGELAASAQLEKTITWKLPASGKYLGQHTLKLALMSTEYGRVVEVSRDVTLHINAGIVGISTSHQDTAMQGEEVAIEVEVQNNGPATVNVPVTLRFPSAAKNPETRSPSVPAEATRTARFTWKTRDYSVGDHMLTVTVPGQHNIASGETLMELPFRVSPLAVAATIVDVSVYPETPSVGERISIAMTVRNDGPIPTPIPITLHYPPGGRQPQTKQPLVAPKQTGTATFDWLTSRYAAGAHQFLVEVAAVDTPQQHFTIDLLPTIENVAIVGMGTYPVETAMVGEPVEVWIDVRNDGPLAINVPVRLTFPSDAKQPERQSPRLEPDETLRVDFEWMTSNYQPGDHTLTAAVLLDDNITVGPTTDEIGFTLTPLIINASILDIPVSPETPRVSEPVTITVNVRNDGRIAANIPVMLHFPPGGRQPEPRSPRADVGDIGEAVFTWHTGHYEPGMHDFRVEVASDPPASQRFEVELLPPIVDVAIVGMGSDPSETAVKGQAVKIWVDVINNGPLALDVPVQLTFPSDRKHPEQKSATIEPGETGRVEFTWKTAHYDAGVHNLTATLLAEHNITELDTTATIQIRLVPAQLIASIADISWSPESPVVGEPVRITVTVGNSGMVAANVPVTLYFPSADKQPETRRPRVGAGAFDSAEFTWRTSRYDPGDHLFRVQIPGVAGAVRTFEIELRPPEIDFAVVDFKAPDPLHPIVKGDWVEITVVVQNRGPYAGRGTVHLLDAADLDTMYSQSASLEPDESRELQFIWKTLRYPVGQYELLVSVDAEHDTDPENDQSDPAPVRLLTDRDITVGLGNNAQPSIFADPTSNPGLRSAPQYPNEVQVTGGNRSQVDTIISLAPAPAMGVPPTPTDARNDPARMYWRWRAAQISPWECVRYQQETGESLPRAILCPKAPALVR